MTSSGRGKPAPGGACRPDGSAGTARNHPAAGAGPRSTAYLGGPGTEGDLIAVTTVRKLSSITGTPDLTATGHLLILARDRPADAFTVRLDNTSRYTGE